MKAHGRRAWRMACGVAAPIGAAWLIARRAGYRAKAGRLGEVERAALAPWFSAATLERVRVARVERVRNPLPRRLMPAGMLDLSSVRGMAFIDTVVIAGANCGGGDDARSLLFHELVHVVQFEALGAVGFVRAYLAGWLGAGRSYLGNPLEVMAFELQERFEGGEAFDVRGEVERLLFG